MQLRRKGRLSLLLSAMVLLCASCGAPAPSEEVLPETEIIENEPSGDESEGMQPDTDPQIDTPEVIPDAEPDVIPDAEADEIPDGEPELPEQQEEILPMEPDKENLLDSQIQQYLDSMTLEEKVAQLFVVTPDALVHLTSVVHAGEKTRQAIQEIPVGGLIYMGNNLVSYEQTQEMLANTRAYSLERIGLVPFLCVDEEGGSVARISGREGFDIAPIRDMAEIGAQGDVEAAHEVGRHIGDYLSQLGFNLDFAPVADVWSNPDNAIVKKRSFGTDPMLVSEMSQAVYDGLGEAGVLGCYKHFPGHGATEGDSHKEYAYTDKSWESLAECELIPFQAAIDHGAQCIMVGHISLPNAIGEDIPASLSEVATTQILRQQMGYDGIIITDALNMKAVTMEYSPEEAAVQALQAGADLLLIPEDFDAAYAGVIQAVEDGTISMDRIDASLIRILSVKLQMNEN